MCVRVCICVCVRASVCLRGQLLGISFLPPLWVPGVEIRSLLSYRHLAGPSLFFTEYFLLL